MLPQALAITEAITQFAFCHKITRNYIFEATKVCGRIVLIFPRLEERQ